MLTSDSDYSIDHTSGRQLAEEPPSSSSLRDSPMSRRKSRGGRRRRWSDRCDCKDGGRHGLDVDSAAALQAPARCPVCGFTSLYAQQLRTRRRPHGEDPRADSENEFFSQKCVELQCYIQPLGSILQGLTSGRYSRRLSSFQESLAIDRIQRIMGVLQNPNMGGPFLNILLKIEGMLRSWFPHIKPDVTDDGAPAKKQKLHGNASSPGVDLPAAALTSSHLRRRHTSPICTLKNPVSALSRRASSPASGRCGQEVTQDNAVSSSSDFCPAHRLSLGSAPLKISSPCLERLLQAKESIIAPQAAGDGGWLSWLRSERSDPEGAWSHHSGATRRPEDTDRP